MTNTVKYGTISMRAYDTKLYKGIHTVQGCYLLQKELNCISHWADIYQIKLNPDKSSILYIGNSKINFDYSLQSKIIRKVTSMNNVGVTAQSNLNLLNHCTEVMKKEYFVIPNLFTIYKYYDDDFYLQMYSTYVRSILEYASQV